MLIQWTLGERMDNKTSSIGEDIERLINSGRLKDAVELIDTYITNSHDPISAHIWFQRGLTATLRGENPESFWDNARAAHDYNDVIEADFRLDNLVLAPLRAGVTNLKRLEEELCKLIPLYSPYPNHTAKLIMVKARIEFARGDLIAASAQHAVAETIFEDQARLGTVNKTWRQNNTYHRFRTERSLINFFKKSRFELVWQLYKQVRQDPARRRSRLFGPFILITGRFGCQVEDFLLKQQNRRFA